MMTTYLTHGGTRPEGRGRWVERGANTGVVWVWVWEVVGTLLDSLWGRYFPFAASKNGKGKEGDKQIDLSIYSIYVHFPRGSPEL